MQLENISKRFRVKTKSRSIIARIINTFIHTDSLTALKNITFSLKEGEILGIVGPNSSGKSTLLRVIAGIYTPSNGKLTVRGKVIPLINLKYGLIDSLTMKDHIILLGVLMGMRKKEIEKKFQSIVGYSELGEYTETKIRHFSEGMKERMIFSTAVHCQYDILLMDEILMLADRQFREKCSNTIRESAENGKIIIIVSHELDLIKKICTKAILLDKGEIIAEGNTKAIISEYEHQHNENKRYQQNN